MIFEVNVLESAGTRWHDLRQRQVVGRDDAERAMGDEALEDGLRADSAIVGVGAVKDFVEQEEGGRFAPGNLEDLAQAHDLRHEV